MIRRIAIAAVALLTLSAAGAPIARSGGIVEFAAPRDGAVVDRPEVRVTGRADRPQVGAAAYDVMIVIDTSGSTRVPASVAVNSRSGPVFGDVFRGSGPTILDAEVTAARRFVDAADRQTTRIGVVTFSEAIVGFGPSGDRTGNAWVEQPLSFDYDAVRTSLRRIQMRPPNGGTDRVAGVRLAIRELRSLSGTISRPRPDARKITLLMTDGFPTLPFGNSQRLDERNIDVTLDAARVAAKAGIVVHTFCIGREALSAPIVCRNAAALTGGTYHPVQNPADIVDILPATRIGAVDVVSVRNATTGQMARRLDVDAEGRFAADVALAPGANRLVAQLHGEAGGTATVVVHYQPEVKIEVERDRSRDVQIQIEKPDKP